MVAHARCKEKSCRSARTAVMTPQTRRPVSAPLVVGPSPTRRPEQAVDSTSALTISVPRDSEFEPDVELETTLVDPGVLEKLAPGSALLVVAHGPATGARFLLDSDITSAGRHPNSDIFLDDITVSRRHADFMKMDDGYHVRDVGSLNGTYVNRSRIDNVVLRNGDEVQIGKYRMMFFASTTKHVERISGEWRMSSASPMRAYMSIGEVLAQLRPEFSDITISKIRFLETEGLVEPQRTPSGYRKFTHADVERLRYVLSAQRDQYLPLKVIREHLAAMDRGLEPPQVPGSCTTSTGECRECRRVPGGGVIWSRPEGVAALP